MAREVLSDNMKRFYILRIIFALTVLLTICGGQRSDAEVYQVDFDEPTAEFLMLQSINTIRYHEGLPLVLLDENLSLVSRRHSLNMARRDFFDHYCPDGMSPADRAHQAGIPNEISENIGIIRTYGQSLEQVVDSLMRSFLESPDHRVNLLDPNITHVGIGFCQDIDGSNHRLNSPMDPDSIYTGFGTILVTQDFCRRRVTLLEPSPFEGWTYPGEFLTVRLDFIGEADEAFLRIIPHDMLMKAYDVPLIRSGRGFRARFAIEAEGAFTVAIFANSGTQDWFYREQGRLELMVKAHHF